MNLPIPESLPDFQRIFPNEEECEKYLFALRFPNGFVCPDCGCDEFYVHRPRRMVKCACCPRQVYLTAGTIMHKSHMPLLTWFYGAFLVTTLTPSISTVQFQKQLGIGSYETAFQMLHKIRSATVDPDREPLHGIIQVDDTYIGGQRKGGKGGRSVEWKTVVVGAVEQRESEGGKTYAGRVRFRVVPDASAASLIPFVTEHILQQSVVITDGWQGYVSLVGYGYQHYPVLSGEGTYLRLIHMEFGNLKTWLLGTYHGRVEEQHLQNYVNEFSFRHNRRFLGFSAFMHVLQIGVQMYPPTYEEIYAAHDQGQSVHVNGREEE